ncbi:unnamed protein product [Diatraea saccharalis]|uniref:Uncharacterized protein n=1 Tax=Diatraea saccharalis TaxID=40085 RepID=A0A9N9WDU7_9NEOP|nr:unnamed protein product [Diatraea saccharalis]
MGLHIDKPRKGSGNSNDGNRVRRFFKKYHCSSEIKGVDEDLIKRFYAILQTFYTHYCYVYGIIVHKISSEHKVLIHGESIFRYFAVLPIDNLSEGAQESRNKDYKYMRLHHSRKCSRSATIEDIFHGLLFTSDPYISSIR